MMFSSFWGGPRGRRPAGPQEANFEAQLLAGARSALYLPPLPLYLPPLPLHLLPLPLYLTALLIMGPKKFHICGTSSGP